MCCICGFCFGEVYGEVAEGFIHVHHIHVVKDGARVVDPAKDLAPVCANCHAVIHLGKSARSIAEMKVLLRGKVVRPLLPEDEQGASA